MVISTLGGLCCALCGKSIGDDAPMRAFPAFLPKTHRWFALSDSAVHAGCLDSWADRDGFLRLYDRYVEVWNSRPRDLKSLKEIEAWGKKAFAFLLDES